MGTIRGGKRPQGMVYMNTATYRKQGMLAHLRAHIKENLYNRTGMEDTTLVYVHIAPS